MRYRLVLFLDIPPADDELSQMGIAMTPAVAPEQLGAESCRFLEEEYPEISARVSEVSPQ